MDKKYIHPNILTGDEKPSLTGGNLVGGTSDHSEGKRPLESKEMGEAGTLRMPTLHEEEENGPTEQECVEAILAENDTRWKLLNLEGIDQFTGEGIEGHTNEVFIEGFSTKKLYLTDELMAIPLWYKCARLGSVYAYTEMWNTLHPDAVIDEDDVLGKLIKSRQKYDVHFAFITCFTILHKVTGTNAPFRLNRAQLLLIAEFEKMRLADEPIRLILLKARQWGGSTATQLYMAWIQLFHKEGWNSVILAQTIDTAKRIKAMYTRVLKHFPADVVFGTAEVKFSPRERSTSDYMVTDSGGQEMRDNTITVASYENFESTRGANFAMAHYSEVAIWVPTQGKTPEGLITNIASGILEIPLTLEVLESTANGMSGYFYDEYQLAKKGDSSRKALFIPFYQILNDTRPFRNDYDRQVFATQLYKQRHDTTTTATSESGEYIWSLWEKGASLESINWYVLKRRSYHDHESIAQEAPSDDVECFKHSGHTIFSQYLIEKYRSEYSTAPIYKGDVTTPDGQTPRLTSASDSGELYVWRHPDHDTPMNDRYMVVVDVGGRGAKSDYSVITVVDRMPIVYGGKAEVVARWRGHIRYDFLASKAVLIARLYCDAFLVFESNTFDKKDAQSTEFTYEGDHTRGILQKVEGEYSNLYMRKSSNPEDLKNGRYKKIGFQTNVKTKQDIVDTFLVSFEDNTDFQDPDDRVYAEMAIYEQREDGSYGNIPGRENHDDILMTDMIANFISLREMPLPTATHSEERSAYSTGTRNESML